MALPGLWLPPGFRAASGGKLPELIGGNTASWGSSSTSAAVTTPSGLENGDLLLFSAAIHRSSTGTPTITPPSGFTTCCNGGAFLSNTALNVAYRFVDGSEAGSYQATVSQTPNRGTLAIHHFKNAGTPSTGDRGTGSGSTFVDPPAHTPSFGATPALWIAVCGGISLTGSGSAPTAIGYPSGYPQFLQHSMGSSGVYPFVFMGAVAQAVASDDPPAFTVPSDGGRYLAYIFAIPGA